MIVEHLQINPEAQAIIFELPDDTPLDQRHEFAEMMKGLSEYVGLPCVLIHGVKRIYVAEKAAS